uniref:Uncharacterized protein n=1 Tax=Rhizophora mucronata TaxID=61149 RepID=A0A2P2PYF6_RHIMU
MTKCTIYKPLNQEILRHLKHSCKKKKMC